MRSEGASSAGKETSHRKKPQKYFSLLLLWKTTDARFSRTKRNESVQLSFSESRTVAAKKNAHNAKKTAAPTTAAAADCNVLAQLLLAQTVAGAGLANDAAKVSAITASVGLESLLILTSLRLSQVDK